MYGFIREASAQLDPAEADSQSLLAGESGSIDQVDDFDERLRDRRASSGVNHVVRHRKQQKLPNKQVPEVTAYGNFVKGSVKVVQPASSASS